MYSRFRKLDKWFLTKAGQNFAFGSALAAAVAIGCIKILPHTFLLDQYRDLVRLYKNGFTVPVSQPILHRFALTLDLLEISTKDKEQIKPFMVSGFDIFSAGSFSSRFGVIVGIPISFTYIDVDVIDKPERQILQNSMPWDTDESRQLLMALTLPEKGQMYAMAREIQMNQNPPYLTDAVTAVGTIALIYFVGNGINTKFNLYAKHRAQRFLMYGFLGLFALVNYIFTKDYSQRLYEQAVDGYLKNKHQIFKEGGKEFYSSMLNRNIALRKLMGEVGENAYTALGNENYIIRKRHLPLLQRKTFFESEPESELERA